MKPSIKLAIATLFVTTAFAGTATANVPVQNLQGTVQSVLGGSGQVQVTLKDGVATLFGYVENGSDEHNVKQAAKNYPGVDRIVDLINES